MLLQIFDDGRLTDSKGRVVNCKNALFIMTSNLGSEQILEKIEKSRTQLTKEDLMKVLDPIIKMHFRPEFINRLDDILPFLPLRKDDMEKIVAIQLNHLLNLLKDRDIGLKWTKEVAAYLAQEGYDPVFGARPLKRLIQQEVVNMLSKGILEGKIPADSVVELKMEGDKLTYKVSVSKAKK
jgi:ATP-dependent Clp protease ATP-binding subunit ClpB